MRAGAARGCSTPSAARFRLPGRAPSRRGGHSRLGGYSEPRCSPPWLPCFLFSSLTQEFSPLCPLPTWILHQGGTIPEQGAALGGSSQALSSTPAPGPASKGYVTPPPPRSPAGPCYAGGRWEAAHTPHRAELVCQGRFEHIFPLFPPFPARSLREGAAVASRRGCAGGHSR